jgi:uncharacterized protein (TIGR03435 family)
MPDMKSRIAFSCFISFSLALAQQATDKPAFEVASIKPSDPNPSSTMWIGMSADSGMVHYTNITLKDCIRAAYRVRDFQIQGPDWINTARFEITAKRGPGTRLDQIPEMLQSLLAERFKLTLRHDTKDQSVYALMIGKSGPKLKASQTPPDTQTITAVGPDGQPRPPMMFQILPSGVHLFARSTSLASFVELMSRFTERPVVDMTGIAGLYDLDLTFAAETTRGVSTGNLVGPDTTAASVEPAQTMFDAVQQYGLKLEARKAPMELLAVTHAEKTPTEN